MNANSDIHLGKYELKHMHDCKTHIYVVESIICSIIK